MKRKAGGVLVLAVAVLGLACDGEIRLRSTTGDANADSGALPIRADGCVDFRSCLPGLHCDSASTNCVECTGDEHCGAGRPRCDAALQRCVECGTELDCPTGMTCERTTRRCVTACAAGGTCQSASPLCDPLRNICVSCVGDADCLGSTEGGACDVQLGRCAQCTDDSRCNGTSAHCDPVTLTCVECTNSNDCQGQCNPATHHCADARDSGDGND